MKKRKNILTVILLTCFMCLALGFQTDAAHPPRMIDDAGLLGDDEKQEIISELNQKSEELQFDIVIVTVESTEGASMRDYADDFFDYNGYGYGETYDGALLLVDMGRREWYISTIGYGREALSDGDLDYIGAEVADEMSYGDYANAFLTFAELVEEEILDERDGDTLTVGEIAVRLVIGLAVGGGLGFIPVTVMKKKMDNVEMRNEASDYVKRDKIMITDSRDMFLYRTINRRRRPKDTGGKSSTHRSSSGRSHGGRGGKF